MHAAVGLNGMAATLSERKLLKGAWSALMGSSPSKKLDRTLFRSKRVRPRRRASPDTIEPSRKGACITAATRPIHALHCSASRSSLHVQYQWWYECTAAVQSSRALICSHFGFL